MQTTNAKVGVKAKAVIFDMDGVITDTMPDHFDAWRTVLQGRGIKVTHLDIYRREGQRGITSVQEIFDHYNQPFSMPVANQILLEKEELFKKNTRNRFIPGTRSLLKYLHKKGFILAIVTGTARHEMLRILPENIRNLFTVFVTGNDVVNGKPSAEPYLLALKNLKLSASSALVIENAPFGVTSAKAAGLRCFAIETSLPKEYLNHADGVFSSIKHLRENIEFLTI